MFVVRAASIRKHWPRSFMKRLTTIMCAMLFMQSAQALANPSQTGETGLINVPSADTLDSGNICIGLWGNVSGKDGKTPAIMPVGLTLGMGSFLEVYGSYPNLLLNRQEGDSGMGTANAGAKLRFFGKRGSNLKLAVDGFIQKHQSKDPNVDGVNDVGTRLIGSLRADAVSIHLSTGYVWTGDIPGTPHENEIIYGAGIEYAPTMRTRVLGELYGRTTTSFGLNDRPAEASLGFQYFFTPHLTFNAAGSYGLTPTAQDWRIIVGFSTCQGIGSYVKPVATPAKVVEERKKKKLEAFKPK